MNPFDGLTKFQIKKLLDLLGVHIYTYNKNEDVLPTIKSENIICIILYGYAEIINIDYNGNENIIEKLSKDSVFGSNLSATNNDDYQIIAKENTQVVVIDYDKLVNPNNLRYSYFNMFFRNLFEIYNVKIKEKNERIRILEKKQIRDKLLEFFEIEHKKSTAKPSKYIELPFSLKDLADYIGSNRAAMFRELKHLKEEKFIEVKNRRINLLYK